LGDLVTGWLDALAPASKSQARNTFVDDVPKNYDDLLRRGSQYSDAVGSRPRLMGHACQLQRKL